MSSPIEKGILTEYLEESSSRFAVSLIDEIKILIPLAIWNTLEESQIERIKLDCINLGMVIGLIFLDSENSSHHKQNLQHIINTMESEGALSLMRAKNVSKEVVKTALKNTITKLLGVGFSLLIA